LTDRARVLDQGMAELVHGGHGRNPSPQPLGSPEVSPAPLSLPPPGPARGPAAQGTPMAVQACDPGTRNGDQPAETMVKASTFRFGAAWLARPVLPAKSDDEGAACTDAPPQLP
jgi:hypothetical protein